MRSTSVLTKNPIRSSSAASLRPAIGLPIAMSVPAPSRRQQPRQPRLQHHEQARTRRPRQRHKPAVQFGVDASAPRARRGGSTPQAAPGPPASSICSGSSFSACLPERQLPRRSRLRLLPPRPAPPAATACSRRTAPAAAAARPVRPPRRARYSAAKVARQRTQRPAVAGDVMQHQQQNVIGAPPSSSA